MATTNTDFRVAEATARTHVHAAIDALLKPFLGLDGNCRRPDPSNAAELAAWDAYLTLARMTYVADHRGSLSRLKLATQ